MIGLLAISGWMAAASYEEYFSAPIQAITTTSPYRTNCRPARATGCSVVGAWAVCRFMVRIMNDPFARYFSARLISGVGSLSLLSAAALRCDVAVMRDCVAMHPAGGLCATAHWPGGPALRACLPVVAGPARWAHPQARPAAAPAGA